MRCAVSRLLFSYIMVGLTCCKRTTEKSVLLDIKMSQWDAFNLRKTVFVDNGWVYKQLELDGTMKFSLNAEKLKNHCGPDVKGIFALSLKKMMYIKEGQVNPKGNGDWPVFESYRCYPRKDKVTGLALLPPIPPKLSSLIITKLSTSQPTTTNVRKTTNDFQRLFKENMQEYDRRIRDLENEKNIQKDRNNRLDATIGMLHSTIGMLHSTIGMLHSTIVMKDLDDEKSEAVQNDLIIQVSLLNIGEAAAELIDMKYKATEGISSSSTGKPNSNVDDTLNFLRSKRNKISHTFKIGSDLNKEINKVLEAYRYLYCTGRREQAINHIDESNLKQLIDTRQDFRRDGHTLAFLLKIGGFVIVKDDR